MLWNFSANLYAQRWERLATKTLFDAHFHSNYYSNSQTEPDPNCILPRWQSKMTRYSIHLLVHSSILCVHTSSRQGSRRDPLKGLLRPSQSFSMLSRMYGQSFSLVIYKNLSPFRQLPCFDLLKNTSNWGKNIAGHLCPPTGLANSISISVLVHQFVQMIN